VKFMSDNIRYSYFHDKFNVVYRYEKATYAMPPHTHNAIEIYLTLSDLHNTLLGSTVTPISSDTLLIIPSYCIHQFTQNENCEYERYILTINTSWLDSILGNTPIARYQYLKDSNRPLMIPLNCEDKTGLINLFDKFAHCSDEDFFLKMSCFFKLMRLINQLAEPFHSSDEHNLKKELSGTRKTTTEIIEYINEHLYESIKIQDIADNFFLNPDYVARIFKKYTNTPIGNYITIQRITKARQLLREGNTVTEVQIKTGYASYEHFFRTFKKTVGISPREYRDKHYKAE
ncbi:MAG: helix-turn-helix transcriptional regulator, partial [Clostridia bacterium]|nr:helix-turn-helix transcriptional regulator [Clostridia bacterium]